MFKEKIKYVDFDGNEREETFYFNLTRAEIIEMEVGESGGYGEMLRRIVESKDSAEIMKAFKIFLLKSYGEKSADGKYFNKSEEISNAFEHSAAYSEIFMKICTNTEYAINFINLVLPLNDEQRKEFQKKAAETTQLPANI